jgi:hypothetical protein
MPETHGVNRSPCVVSIAGVPIDFKNWVTDPSTGEISKLYLVKNAVFCICGLYCLIQAVQQAECSQLMKTFQLFQIIVYGIFISCWDKMPLQIRNNATLIAMAGACVTFFGKNDAVSSDTKNAHSVAP